MSKSVHQCRMLLISFLLSGPTVGCSMPLKSQPPMLEMPDRLPIPDSSSLIQQLDTLRIQMDELTAETTRLRLENQALKRAALALTERSNARADESLNLSPQKQTKEVLQKPAEPKPADSKLQMDRARQEYESARETFKADLIDSAILQFAAFARAHPDSDLVGNAYFWLGHCYLKKGETMLALDEFTKVITDYPQGNKAADAEYEVARIYQKLGWWKKALSLYKHFDRTFQNHPLATTVRTRHDELKAKLEAESSASEIRENVQ